MNDLTLYLLIAITPLTIILFFAFLFREKIRQFILFSASREQEGEIWSQEMPLIEVQKQISHENFVFENVNIHIKSPDLDYNAKLAEFFLKKLKISKEVKTKGNNQYFG